MTTLRILGVVCLLTLARAVAQAEVDVPPAKPSSAMALDATRRQWLAELADPRWDVRQNATRRLLQADDLTDEQMDAMYAAATLPEQRQRLRDIALHHMLRRMQPTFPGKAGDGSLGLKFQPLAADERPETRGAGIGVVATYPGFPAFAYLQPGDVILSVGDRPVTEGLNGKWFPSQVQACPLDQTLPLKVSRGDLILDMRVPVVSRQWLDQAYRTDAALPNQSLALGSPYRQQWRDRVDQLRKLEPRPEPLIVPDSSATEPPAANTLP
ncbi:MAG: PDZ domain-containing protein [Phycisphaeraceae bacterium]|nr:PDZ domain-containing protein [Phycisphaeraceae bacterium]